MQALQTTSGIHPWASSELALLAARFQSDKGFHVLNAHGYTRLYESLLRESRQATLHLLEVGLLHLALHANRRLDAHGKPLPFDAAPSLQMWAEYLPQARIVGVDIEDFSALVHPRIRTLQADQGKREALRQAVGAIAADGFDLIIDDGSHASHHQQITLGALWPLLKAGGVYVIEDLHYQPADLEPPGLIKTQVLLELLRTRHSIPDVPSAIAAEDARLIETQVAAVVFFDSLDAHRPHAAQSKDAFTVIHKQL
jgi:hypothetical protein